jgi:hypothetical protein
LQKKSEEIERKMRNRGLFSVELKQEVKIGNIRGESEEKQGKILNKMKKNFVGKTLFIICLKMKKILWGF